MLWEGAGRACLSGAVLVRDLAWEVALSGLLGGIDCPFLVCPVKLAGSRVPPFSLSPCSNLFFNLPNSLSLLTAFFPFSFPSVHCCFCFLPSLLLGSFSLHCHFEGWLFEAPELQCSPVHPMTRCNSEVPRLFF